MGYGTCSLSWHWSTLYSLYRVKEFHPFFSTNNTGAPHDKVLGKIKPRSFNSWTCFLSSCIWVGAIQYGVLDIGRASKTNSMQKSISLLGGNPEILWNTSSKSCIIKIWTTISSALVLLITARQFIRNVSLEGLH